MPRSNTAGRLALIMFKSLAAISLLILGPMGVVLFLLKLSGFCFSKSEWKSNRELIEAAFQYELDGGWSNTPAVPDVSAYLREHPRCCSVSGSDPFVGDDLLLNALFGRRFYAVSIKYPVTDPVGEPFYESILIMDCCGEYVPDAYGMGSSEPVPKGPPPAVDRRRKAQRSVRAVRAATIPRTSAMPTASVAASERKPANSDSMTSTQQSESFTSGLNVLSVIETIFASRS
jgi:hypothetical protein